MKSLLIAVITLTFSMNAHAVSTVDSLKFEAGAWNSANLSGEGRVVNCAAFNVTHGQCVVNKYNPGGTVTVYTLSCNLLKPANAACTVTSAETKPY